MGFIITEVDVRWSRNRGGGRRRCLGTKRVPRWSGFSFRCHRATNERKRERKRQTEKHQTVQYKNIKKRRYVCMKNA